MPETDKQPSPSQPTTNPPAESSGGRVSIQKTYKLYIGGEFPRTESGRSYAVQTSSGDLLANLCRASRKDVRNAVSAARDAFPGWAKRTAFNRSQIAYRMAEMLEGRKVQFITELVKQGAAPREAELETTLAIERIVHYAGWADKYQQVFSSVNPVNSSHFNFSMLEPTGVVGIRAPENSSLLGLVSMVLPSFIGGNTSVVIASREKPLCAITFAEVLAAADVPGGVVNVLTGFPEELLPPLASHLDVNALLCGAGGEDEVKQAQQEAAGNVKAVHDYSRTDWMQPKAQSPYYILDTQETKTTWHPIGL